MVKKNPRYCFPLRLSKCWGDNFNALVTAHHKAKLKNVQQHGFLKRKAGLGREKSHIYSKNRCTQLEQRSVTRDYTITSLFPSNLYQISRRYVNWFRVPKSNAGKPNKTKRYLTGRYSFHWNTAVTFPTQMWKIPWLFRYPTQEKSGPECSVTMSYWTNSRYVTLWDWDLNPDSVVFHIRNVLTRTWRDKHVVILKSLL